MNDSAQSIDHRLLLDQRGWMRRLVAELVSDPHAREDVVQETLRVALERPPTSRNPGVLRGWLATVLRNRVRQGQRRDGARRWHEATRARDAAAFNASFDERLELETRLTEALRSLRAPYREAIALRYFDGMSVRQVARRLDISEDATAQRLSRGLARLRERLDGDYRGRSAWRAVGAAWAPAASAPARAGAAVARIVHGVEWRLLLGVVLAASIPLALWIRTDATRTAVDARLAPLEPRGLSADSGWTPPERIEIRRPRNEVAAVAQDSEPEASVTVDVPDAVDAYLAPLVESRLFSGTVLLARGGEIVHSKAYGKAHFGQGLDNATDTRFKLMSVTKSFTAVAVMTLEQDGRLGLDDSVGVHLAPWPAAWSDVTLRHLLSHTSGIPNLEREWGMGVRRGRARGLEVWPGVEAQVESTPLASVPGEVTSYSNFNYVLLGLVIESVSGKSYERYLGSAVLAPAGLEHTGCDDGSRRPGLSIGYFRSRDGGLDESTQDMSVIRGAGDLYSTAPDLYRLDRALGGDELLAAETRAEMLTPVNGRFALGWQISRMLDRECVHHSGGANGYVADFLRFPEEDACVVVLSNFAFAPAGRISSDLAAILFDEPYERPVELERAELARYEGVYSTEREPGRTLLVRRSGDLLMSFDVHDGVERCGANLLVPIGDGVFVLPWLHAHLEFEVPEGEERATLRYRIGERAVEMQRQPVDELAWLGAVGSYDTEPTLGSSVSIVETGAGFELHIEGGWPTLLDLVIVSSEHAIARPAETFGTQLHLTRDALGAVDGFRWERADGETFIATRKP